MSPLQRANSDSRIYSAKVVLVIPPKAEYSLTEEGKTIGPILIQLCAWGKGWLRNRGLTTLADDVRLEDSVIDGNSASGNVICMTRRACHTQTPLR
ncbi:winged helix-turn-helix transcriptional regulator [Agrobacterium leguminum]|uniref:winged helix-turn-helix transcriptional regulator n=1 Tax=Agrobacterium leguminum TaxID=2792015 RepID=UPI001F1D47C4|nr:winged helix-turn-helix transcriptional regulator [Agrobacterium leguminum]